MFLTGKIDYIWYSLATDYRASDGDSYNHNFSSRFKVLGTNCLSSFFFGFDGPRFDASSLSTPLRFIVLRVLGCYQIEVTVKCQHQHYSA